MGCRKLSYYQAGEGLEKATAHFFGHRNQKRGQQIFCVNYYPFGLTFNSYTSGTQNKYLYNQGEDPASNAERQPELGLDMTMFRMYDYALGRFTSIDPKADQANQESWNPYQYAFNNPILYNDPLGDTVRVTGSDEFKQQTLTNLQALTDHTLEMTDDGTVIVSETSCNDGCDSGNDLVDGLVHHDNTVTIGESTKGNATKGGTASEANRKSDGTPGTGVKQVTVDFNPNKKTGGVDENGSRNRPTEIGLGHELIHAGNRMNGTRSTGSSGVRDPDGSGKILSNEELNTRKAENRLRKERGLPLRKIK